MTFSNLSEHDKSAFFSLLDEYFNSRSGLLASDSRSPATSTDSTQAAAARAVRLAVTSHHPNTAELSPSQSAASEHEVGATPISVKSRVAAASQLFGQQKPATQSSGGLVSARKMGDVSLSSTKDFFGSVRNSTANKTAPPPSFPPAAAELLPAKKNTFAPPPTRRIGSSSNASNASLSSPPLAAEPEPAGEWAEALYDYSSSEAGDLSISKDERIFVTDRSDDNWWRGEIDGRSGLFPASYVALV